MASAVATLNPEEALNLMKQVDSDVQDIVQRAASFEQCVVEVHKQTNMPVVNQIFDTASKLTESLKKVQSSTADALNVMNKYAADVDEIANDDTGLSRID